MSTDSSVTCAVCGRHGPKDEFIKQRSTHLDSDEYPPQAVALNLELDVEYEFECEDHAIRRQVRQAHRENGEFDEKCQ